MLDASTRIDVLNVLADFKAGGLSILFITHDLSLAYYISERAVILQRGRVVEMGSTERVFRNPLHPYTKMLMASVPRLDKRWEVVEREVGQTARPSELAAGVADEDSVERGTGLVEAEQGHFVAIAG
jgi:peptide/nickel transport system ATP-binding protein